METPEQTEVEIDDIEIEDDDDQLEHECAHGGYCQACARQGGQPRMDALYAYYGDDDDY